MIRTEAGRSIDWLSAVLNFSAICSGRAVPIAAPPPSPACTSPSPCAAIKDEIKAPIAALPSTEPTWRVVL